MQSSKSLSSVLEKYSGIFSTIVSFDLNDPSVLIFDLSEQNKDLLDTDLLNTETFTKYIFGQMAKANTSVAIGRYNEDRIIYKRSKHFQGSQNRTIHLGIDIWAEAGTPVFSPLAGSIHSFHNNKGFGDYGPTIILEHSLDGITFYTLYGHLSMKDISELSIHQEINKGQLIGYIGNFPENGNWPPHLHFQIIADLQGNFGDFPGVAASSMIENYLQICPDPNLILGIKKLMY